MPRHQGFRSVLAAGLLLWGWQGGAGVFAGDAGVKRIEVVLADHKLLRESDVVRVTQGQAVELVWTSDEATEVHLHGYDIELKLRPDQPAVMALTAHATGRFPVTRHGSGEHTHETLLYLEVYPGE